jgi:hypothetical protein
MTEPRAPGGVGGCQAKTETPFSARVRPSGGHGPRKPGSLRRGRARICGFAFHARHH